MSDDFIEVYAKATGLKQLVPAHFLDNPVLSKGLELTPSGREQQRLNAGPSMDWTLEQLQTHAGPDAAGLRTKAEVLAVIEAAAEAPTSSPETGSTGPGSAATGAEDTPNHENPDAGDEE